MDFPRQANAHAAADCSHRPSCGAEPKRTRGTQVGSIKALVDLHGFGEAPGPRVRSRTFVVLRKRCIISMPIERFQGPNSTPAPMPGSSLVTFAINDEP